MRYYIEVDWAEAAHAIWVQDEQGALHQASAPTSHPIAAQGTGPAGRDEEEAEQHRQFPSMDDRPNPVPDPDGALGGGQFPAGPIRGVPGESPRATRHPATRSMAPAVWRTGSPPRHARRGRRTASACRG
jgi:hypothetical protein